MSKMIGKVMIEQELMQLQEQSNRREFERREIRIKNRCQKCKDCLLEKYIKMSEYDPALLDIIPQKGEIWSKEYQCKEILKIMNGGM